MVEGMSFFLFLKGDQTMSIQELISGKGFIMVNKELAKAIGLVPATIYGELVSTFLYWKERDQLTVLEDKEWFFCTIEDLEDKTSVKKDSQNKAIKTLEKEGLIITKRFGLPAKRYFYITDKYIQILFENYISEKPKTDNDGISSDENTEKPLDDQISEKPKTEFRENRKLHFGKTDTNNKELNNKHFNNKIKRERDLLKGTEIDLELKQYIGNRLEEFAAKDIDLKTVLNWIEANDEIYTYSEFAAGINQLLEFPESIKNIIRFLNKTFSNIDQYLADYRKKQMKKNTRAVSKMKNKTQNKEISSYSRSVPFYNWLEE